MKPAPKLSLVEWAETYRVLPTGSAVPGKWQTSRVEPAREVMLAVTQPGVRKLTVMGPSQLLKTDLLLNIIGYFAHQDPSPMILMQPDIGTAEAFSKDRLAKMIESTPVLAELFSDKSRKTSKNSVLYKVFPGGSVSLVGSNSPSGLAMRAVRVVLVDEIDRAAKSAGNEGTPLLLLEKRMTTFWNSLSVRVSSPTIQGDSAIEAEYEQSDKRVWHSKCPHCNQYEVPQWAQVSWPKGEPSKAVYTCSACDKPWTEPQRMRAIRNGKYIATAPFAGHAGFKLNGLASPWLSVGQIAEEFLIAKEDTDMLKTFWNTRMAETWVVQGDKPDYIRLYERRESYQANTIASKQIVFMTCGADVQKDRIECEIVGWSRDKQSWSIDYRTFWGETHTEEPWAKLDALLAETWQTPAGLPMQISMLAVDSGYNTQHVYNFCRKYSVNRVRAIKGSAELATKFGTPSAVDLNSSGERLKRAAQVWPLGVSLLKSELYGWLKLAGAGEDGIYPPGFCHLPDYSEQHFKQLCAEQLVELKVKGRTKYEWQKTMERNEQLDCRVYARAAAAMFGMDLMKPEDWDYLAGTSINPVMQEPAIKPMSRGGEGVNAGKGPASSIWGSNGSGGGFGKKSIW